MPRSVRCRNGEIWRLLAGPWALDDLPVLVETVELADLAPQVDRILRGDVRGRVLVRVGGELARAVSSG